MDYNINFPHLHIFLEHVGKELQIGDFTIAYYGIIMAIGMLCGLVVALLEAKRTEQEEEHYLDIAFWGIIFSVICARIYYVAFRWDQFRYDPLRIFNLRTGGIAMYGSIIGAVLTAFVYCRIKDLSVPLVFDTAVLGLLTGQIIGRWGNFFNREVFGEYTDSLFAMQLPVTAVRDMDISEIQKYNFVEIDGVTYLQAHPTFLYESVWNLALLVFLLAVVRYKKKFDGEVFLCYLAGYGLGRFFIEYIRTDQLYLWNTKIPVSMVVAAVTFVFAVVMIAVCRRRAVQAANAGDKEEEF